MTLALLMVARSRAMIAVVITDRRSYGETTVAFQSRSTKHSLTKLSPICLDSGDGCIASLRPNSIYIPQRLSLAATSLAASVTRPPFGVHPVVQSRDPFLSFQAAAYWSERGSLLT